VTSIRLSNNKKPSNRLAFYCLSLKNQKIHYFSIIGAIFIHLPSP